MKFGYQHLIPFNARSSKVEDQILKLSIEYVLEIILETILGIILEAEVDCLYTMSSWSDSMKLID